jgi:predicted transcriptional regulator
VIKETEQILVSQNKVKSKLILPSDTTEIIKNLPMLERKAYAVALVKEGWTLQSIAGALGVSREAVRLYTIATLSDETIKKISHLPIPSVPVVEKYKTRLKKVRLEPEVLEQLKELHAKATLVRSSSKKYRKEAEDFTKLAWEQTQKGVSVYSIAKALGITHGALLFRFVRYGYKTTNGKSRVFRKVEHRITEGENK